MEEAEFVGKVNRFGTEYNVYLNPVDKSIVITDTEGTQLRYSSKKVTAGDNILEMVLKILRSVGL